MTPAAIAARTSAAAIPTGSPKKIEITAPIAPSVDRIGATTATLPP